MPFGIIICRNSPVAMRERINDRVKVASNGI